LLVLGRNSLAFYQNTGNAVGSPFSVIKELTSRIGCTPSLKPVAQVGDSIYWTGGGQGYNNAAWTLTDFKAEKISNSAIDRHLNNLAINFMVSAFAIDGNEYMLLVSNQTPRQTYLLSKSAPPSECYFLSSGSVVASGGGATSNPADSQGVYCVDLNSTDGKVFKLDSTTFRDNSASFTMTIQTGRNYLAGGKSFVTHYIDLIADTQASGSTTLEVSTDDYASWKTVGTYDLTKQKKRIYAGVYAAGGHAIFRLTDSGNQAWRGQSLSVGYSPCSV
jgi:hypothetical protein